MTERLFPTKTPFPLPVHEIRMWAADDINTAREVGEAALAHAVGDATERAYSRTDFFEKRRTLMDKWARYCIPKKPRQYR